MYIIMLNIASSENITQHLKWQHAYTMMLLSYQIPILNFPYRPTLVLNSQANTVIHLPLCTTVRVSLGWAWASYILVRLYCACVCVYTCLFACLQPYTKWAHAKKLNALMHLVGEEQCRGNVSLSWWRAMQGCQSAASATRSKDGSSWSTHLFMCSHSIGVGSSNRGHALLCEVQRKVLYQR